LTPRGIIIMEDSCLSHIK